MDYAALITVEEVRTALLGSGGRLEDSLQVASSADYAECERVIEDVTGRIEDYLNRRMIVREHTIRYKCGIWRTRQGWEDGSDMALLTAWAPEWPVLRVASVDGDALFAPEIIIGEYRAGGQFLAYNPNSTLITDYPWQIVYTAGFRREDQSDLATLRTESGLTADQLPALPPILPRAIRRAAIRLVIYELTQEREGLVGVASRSRQIESATVASVRMGVDYETQVLQTIFPYRNNVA